ncbi:type IV secretory system conjugative DNA transfer family protein [Salmonella enterica subsp. enterica serovar Benue]|uniref:type IV secretory system conjugative DNA transfer family protein n=1 Tax=Salmonella enterica TaxID=28901 RepID=UPI000F9F709C|nr:type IV secretory system conjugative DNA transfer family protein [Salmonella enterica]EDR3562094.1 type IV secretory system conjugative DNA transfer family protein [Salmonella enterica subsp. enterica serovar Benue]MIW33721.1 type IV secretory system conjugative DNA transfer family protein [Salmonella enterica subsp. enterica serovar Derby]MBH0601266.1 type IV secretory system conjugative DNA transfer family protein [Salmonella enterica]MBH0654962.1 type IV secretory system conjugative DNA t
MAKAKKGKHPEPTKYPGIILGKHPRRNDFLCSYGQTFAMLAAEPGSGKGVGAVIPNLMLFPDSVVVCDPKRENYEITAGFRSKMGHECYCFQPESLQTHRYNPLAYLRQDTLYRVGDTRTVASTLFSPGGDTKNAGWYKKAGDAFTAIVLFLMETPEMPLTLPQVYEIAAAPVGVANWIEKTVAARKQTGRPLSHECERELMNFASGKSNPAGFASTEGILKERLSLFAEKTVANALSGNDFDFRELRKKRMSIYFCVSQTALKKFGILMNLFFTQAILENTSILPEQGGTNPDGTRVLKYQVLMLMDEFAVMGVIDVMKTAPALTRAYNVRYLIIFQNKAQLRDESMYGKEGANAIMEAFHVEMVYAMKDFEASKEYSDRLGNTTVKSISESRNYGKSGGRSRSKSDHVRPLMLPQEITEMSYSEQLIFISGTKKSKPLKIKARKIFWYEEEKLKVRANLPLPSIPKADESRISSLTVPATLPDASVEFTASMQQNIKAEEARRKKITQ